MYELPTVCSVLLNTLASVNSLRLMLFTQGWCWAYENTEVQRGPVTCPRSLSLYREPESCACLL